MSFAPKVFATPKAWERASLKFRVLPLGNAMTVLISSSLINSVLHFQTLRFKEFWGWLKLRLARKPGKCL
jgi:hypothetical protein